MISSLVPRSSLTPNFDCLQYAKTFYIASDKKLEPGKARKRGYKLASTNWSDRNTHALCGFQRLSAKLGYTHCSYTYWNEHDQLHL